MDLKEWFEKRQKRKEQEKLVVKNDQPLTTEEYCALWTQCFQCRELLYTRDLRGNQHVCPKCQYHFRIGALQRIEQIADSGTFVELDANLVSADPLNWVDIDTYPRKQEENERKSGLKDAIVTGTCKIDGNGAALGVMDFGYFGGSMGSVVGEKIARLIEKAIELSLPVILVSSSGGARMQEGILSLMQLAKTSSVLKTLSDKGLMYISILTEPTFGGVTASFAMLGDVIIAEPGARIGFAGRRVIEDTIRQKLPADFQTAEYLLKHGQVDMVVDRTSMKKVIAELIRFHSKKKDEPNKGAKVADSEPAFVKR